MRAYMGYYNGESGLGACLIFAHSVKEAKELAWPVIKSWFSCDYIDMCVSWLKNQDYLFKQADPVRMAADEAHVIESPKLCKFCELWTNEIGSDGICTDCKADK